MHKIYIIIYLLLWSLFSFAQVDNVGIGTTTPDPSAILEVQATDQGFLLPRMDQAGEDALSSPAQGLMIFNTDINNGIGLQAPRFYNGNLWNTILTQKSNGELFLDNGGFNWFNTSAGAAIDFNINSGMVLRLESNQNVVMSKPGTDENIYFVNGHHITTRGDDYNVLKDLYLNYDGGAVRLGPGHLTLGPWGSWRAIFYEDSNVQFTNHGLGNSLIFHNGDHIQARSPDWQQPRTLYLNHNGGEISLGPGTVSIGGWNAQRTWFYSDGNARFHKPGTDQNILFINGNTINASGNVWNTPKTLFFHFAFFGQEDIWPQPLPLFRNNVTIDGQVVAHDMEISGFPTIELNNLIHNNLQNTPFNDFELSIDVDDEMVIEYHPSSKRFKKNIRTAKIYFRNILQLKVKEYHFREEYQINEMQLGVIAEEADELGLSYLVYHNKENQVDGFRYKKIGLYLLPLVQEQEEQIQQRQKALEALKAELAAMEQWKEEVEALLRK